MSVRAAFERLDRLLERLPLPARLMRFGIVGGTGVLVNLVCLALLRWAIPALAVRLGVADGTLAGWSDRLAMAGGIAVSIFTNFLLNDAWTWGDRPKGGRRHWLQRLGKFYLVSLVAALVQWGVAVVVFEVLELWIYLAQLVGIGVALVINFAANHLWTFRGRRKGQGEAEAADAADAADADQAAPTSAAAPAEPPSCEAPTE